LAMERKYRLDVPLDAEGKRLDKFLINQPVHLSRSQVQHLIENGLVLVNAKTRRSSYRVHAGDIIEMQVLASEETPLIPEDIPLDIIYEDEDLLVVNKPQGMVVHPAAGHEKGTLVNALLNHCTQLSRRGGLSEAGDHTPFGQRYLRLVVSRQDRFSPSRVITAVEGTAGQ
jgi:23S rRNA pseudouridine1911/1915/1917 synthase